MEGDMFSIGGQFGLASGREQGGQRQSQTYPPGYVLPSQAPSLRQAQPSAYPVPPTQTAGALSPYPQQVRYGPANPQSHSYASVVRGDMQAKGHQSAPSNTRPPSKYEQRHERYAEPRQTFGQPQSGSSRSVPSARNIRGETYAQIIHRQTQSPTSVFGTPGAQAQTQQHAQSHQSDNDVECQMQYQQGLADTGQAQIGTSNSTYPFSNAPSHSIFNEIASNPNYNPYMTDTANSLAGWNRQTRNIGDRTVLSVDTSHLQPPQSPYTPLSPGSVTSATSSRPSRKRNREQMRSGDYPFRCIVCDAGFYTSADLWHHFRYHEDPPWPCNACHKRFTFEKDLKRHYESIHRPDSRNYPCLYYGCTSAYKRKDHLSRHVNATHASDSGIGPSGQTSMYNGN